MKKSQLRSLIREAVVAKMAKVSIKEGIMSELDILAQESNTFQEFLGKVKADPTYKSFDVNDREVMEFLLAMYNDSASLDEAVDFKSTTTDQFLKMLQQVKQNKLFPNAKWGFAKSVGGGTSYLPFDQFVRELTDLIRQYKDQKDPITSCYVWNMEGSGLNYNDTKKVINGGTDAVLQFAQVNGDKVTKISTGWDSQGKQRFASSMGRGDYGSLDESAMGDIDIVAQESTSFEDFLSKVSQDPDLKMADVNDPEVKMFLQSIWDDVVKRGDVNLAENTRHSVMSLVRSAIKAEQSKPAVKRK